MRVFFCIYDGARYRTLMDISVSHPLIHLCRAVVEYTLSDQLRELTDHSMQCDKKYGQNNIDAELTQQDYKEKVYVGFSAISACTMG